MVYLPRAMSRLSAMRDAKPPGEAVAPEDKRQRQEEPGKEPQVIAGLGEVHPPPVVDLPRLGHVARLLAGVAEQPRHSEGQQLFRRHGPAHPLRLAHPPARSDWRDQLSRGAKDMAVSEKKKSTMAVARSRSLPARCRSRHPRPPPGRPHGRTVDTDGEAGIEGDLPVDGKKLDCQEETGEHIGKEPAAPEGRFEAEQHPRQPCQGLDLLDVPALMREALLRAEGKEEPRSEGAEAADADEAGSSRRCRSPPTAAASTASQAMLEGKGKYCRTRTRKREAGSCSIPLAGPAAVVQGVPGCLEGFGKGAEIVEEALPAHFLGRPEKLGDHIRRPG